jgi:hypothetical protein
MVFRSHRFVAHGKISINVEQSVFWRNSITPWEDFSPLILINRLPQAHPASRMGTPCTCTTKVASNVKLHHNNKIMIRNVL